MQNTKKGVFIVVLSVFLILLISAPAYAGLFDWFEDFRARVTGEATRVTEINITVGAGGGVAPNITNIFNGSVIGGALNEGAANTNFTVNFTVVDADGFTNLVDASASINFSKSGEDPRYSITCARYEGSGEEANYTCEVQMWWFDGSGAWVISANISDNNGNAGINNTDTFSVSETTGFVQAPGNLTFGTLTLGSENNTASELLLLNNTGNKDIAQSDISINATSLVGEANSAFSLYSGNFSVGNTTGSNAECSYSTGSNFATRMNFTSGGDFVNITTGVMNAGNFTINNGIEGQEQLYFCNLLVGSEVDQQSYSTTTNGAWTVQIVIILPFIREYLLELSYVTIFPISLALIKNINKKGIVGSYKNEVK